MRIGIDARFYQESGVGRYLRNLIDNLKSKDLKNEYFIFLIKDDFENFPQSKNFKKVLADFSWYGFAEQFKFPSLLKKYNLDLIHFPHFNTPIFYNGKFVVTIHDLIHQHFQMKRTTTLSPLFYLFKHFGYKRVFKNAVSKSEKILVPSKFISELLSKEWKVNKEKIVVTYEAVDEQILSYAKNLSKTKIEQIIKKFNVIPPFIFYVGNAHPHKNLEGLISSFLILRKKYQYLQLVLSGADHYFWDRLKREYQHKNIIYTGKVTDEELVALYKSAKCFVMPSFEEGFGIPILEAMACGCPVVCSNAASLPEVGGEAASYFDPKNPQDLIQKVSNILDDNKYSERLIELGKEKVKQYSWEKLAAQTLGVYEKCV